MSILQSQQEVGLGLIPATRMPRVNLLPPEIVEGRQVRRTQKVLAGSLVALVAVLGSVYVVQVNAKSSAQEGLSQAQGQGARLQAAQAKYADVPRTIAAIDSADTARANAMGSDVEWYRVMTNFAVTLPSDVWFKTVQMNVGGTEPGGSASGTAVAAPASGAPTIGAITVDGQAMDHPDVAAWLDVLGRQPGLTDAYFSSSARNKIGDKTVVDFSSSASITDEMLSHRYDRKQG